MSCATQFQRSRRAQHRVYVIEELLDPRLVASQKGSAISRDHSMHKMPRHSTMRYWLRRNRNITLKFIDGRIFGYLGVLPLLLIHARHTVAKHEKTLNLFV
jgi:hypothetical protein